VCLHEPHDQRRRRRLWATVRHVPGQVEIGERCKLDFRLESASGRLAEQMAHAIAYGWEGFVLKDCRAPCLHCLDHLPHVTVKMHYIPGLGDFADLVIIGGSRDAQQEYTLGMEPLHGRRSTWPALSIMILYFQINCKKVTAFRGCWILPSCVAIYSVLVSSLYNTVLL
jgi:hypothetical protein